MSRSEEFESGYHGHHRPADPDHGAPLHDLTGNGIYPADIYTHPHYYESEHHPETLNAIHAARGRPNKSVKIYRALPDKSQGINTGDWVTTSRKYAVQHSRHPHDPAQDMPVVSRTVKAQHLITSGDSLNEWGYHGPSLPGRKPPTPKASPYAMGGPDAVVQHLAEAHGIRPEVAQEYHQSYGAEDTAKFHGAQHTH